MNFAPYFRYTVVTFAAATLMGCATHQSVVLYEPSTAAKSATFSPGDRCSRPTYLFGSVSTTKKAMVSLSVPGNNEPLGLNLEVVTKGDTSFTFKDASVVIIGVNLNSSDSTKVVMGNFSFSTGGGHYSDHEFSPLENLAGPPRDSFAPYYPENGYEVTQWSFSSNMTLPFLRPEQFSVQIPDAVVDGETLSFPLITFQRRVMGYRASCLK